MIYYLQKNEEILMYSLLLITEIWFLKLKFGIIILFFK